MVRKFDDRSGRLGRENIRHFLGHDFAKDLKDNTHFSIPGPGQMSLKYDIVHQDFLKRAPRAITFQLAEVAVIGPMVRAILAAIRRLRAPPLCT